MKEEEDDQEESKQVDGGEVGGGMDIEFENEDQKPVQDNNNYSVGPTIKVHEVDNQLIGGET